MALLKEYSYKQGAALSIGSTFVWKMLSFINSILVAFYFGTKTNCDIYFYILFIGGIIVFLFTSLNSNVLIPQAIYLRKTSEEKAKTFLNSFLLLYVFFLTIIAGICIVFPIDIFAIISKFSIDILGQDILILRLAFIYFATYILCSYILNIMYVYHIFSINFIFPLNALLPMFFLILFHNILGLKTMLIGFSTSYLIHMLVCLFIMKKKLNWSFTSFQISLEKRLKNNIITNQILVITNLFVSVLPLYLMSNFTGGIISALSYAKQLTDSPKEILTSKVAGIYHIQLNENASAKDFAILNANYLKVTYMLLFIMIPLALFTFYFAPDIVNLFFKRGKFNLESASNVVKFLRPLMILLILTNLMPLLNSLIAGTRKIKESFIYTLIINIISAVSLYFCISHFGPFAYPYILIFCAIVTFLIMALFFKIHIPQINFWQPLKDAVLLVFLNIIALIPAGFIGYILEDTIEFIKILCSGIMFLLVLTLLCLFTGQLKKVLHPSLGTRYDTFTNKIPTKLQPFFK